MEKSNVTIYSVEGKKTSVIVCESLRDIPTGVWFEAYSLTEPIEGCVAKFVRRFGYEPKIGYQVDKYLYLEKEIEK